METLLQDLRYGIRNLSSTKGVALIAILTLALGIGVNTAIFSVINAVLLQPLPFHDPGKLVNLRQTEAAPGSYPISAPDYLDWKRDNKTFQDMSFFHWPHNMNASDNGQSQQILAIPTEANFFSVLGVQPLLGRTWAPGEDQAGGSRIVVLSYGLWKSMFNSDPKIIGRNIELDAAAYTVVGVMKPTFQFPVGTQLWIPQDMSTKALGSRGSHGPGAIGRLKPGVTVEQALADLNVIDARLQQQYPLTNHDVKAIVTPLHESLVGRSRASLILMLWAVLLVLLIACVNVANLLLSRAVARQKEMAVRAAIGASRSRLIRQLLTESVLIAVFGGVVGLFVAIGGIQLLTSMKRLALPPTNPVEINLPVLLFTFGVSVFSGIIFGLVPAFQTSRPDLSEDLKGAGASSLNRHKRSTSNVLVIAEVGFALLLLISAGLLLKDFITLRNTNIGVRTDHVWTASLRLPTARYAEQPQQFQFAESLLDRIRQVPGVESVSITDTLPLNSQSNGYIHLPGHETEGQGGPLVESHNVSIDYFKTLNIPVLQGRTLNQEDLATEIRIDETLRPYNKEGKQPDATLGRQLLYRAVINQTMANTIWPGQNPIGQIYTTGNESGPWQEVVGVVGDVRQAGLAAPPRPEAYHVWDGQAQFNLMIHTSVEPSSITGAVREAVASADSSLPLNRVRTMQDVISDSSAGAQFTTTLLSLFAALALVLAIIGIYGVLSYQVTQRTREIGIRLALGASQRNVLNLVVGEGLRLALIGFAIGMLSALAARKLLSASLQVVKAGDPSIFVLAPLLLVVVAAAACFVPASRASRIHPMVALREE
jgi:putative ABC transport system permease protein